MRPKAAAFIIACGVVVLAALVALALWWLSRHAGVRRSEYKRMAHDRNRVLLAIQQIEAKADDYRDIDSILATEVRSIVRDLNTERMDLSQ